MPSISFFAVDGVAVGMRDGVTVDGVAVDGVEVGIY